jgi:formamidopyrimidine-DNA glycosylase
MPELPEVEIMARNLERWTCGLRLSRLEVVDPRVVAGGDPRRAVGHQVRRAWRRAKYAVLDLDDVGHLVFHFRMTGKVVARSSVAGARLWFQAGDQVVGFEDARCLGQIWWVDAGEIGPFFADRGLGPEPWPEPRDGRWWAAQLQGLRGPIKPALMRQDRVAGIGNILGSEACWRARLHPATPVPTLSDADWAQLAAAVHQTIEHTLQAESGEEIVYVNQGGLGSFTVYGRAGEPCPRCGGSIQRMVQSGRGSFFCPGCQPCL